MLEIEPFGDTPVQLIAIPGGTFLMRSPAGELDLNPDPSRFRGDDLLVEQVSWVEAKEFCDRLSRLSGRRVRIRLPGWDEDAIGFRVCLYRYCEGRYETVPRSPLFPDLDIAAFVADLGTQLLAGTPASRLRQQVRQRLEQCF